MLPELNLLMEHLCVDVCTVHDPHEVLKGFAGSVSARRLAAFALLDSADRTILRPEHLEIPMILDTETVRCWLCPHDVDDHDERARCVLASCGCGW